MSLTSPVFKPLVQSKFGLVSSALLLAFLPVTGGCFDDKESVGTFTASSGSNSGRAEGRDVSGRLSHGKFERTYLLHLPSVVDSSEKLPLVIVFHGGFGTGSRVAKKVGFDQIADNEKFMVVYPDGIDKHWNDGRSTTTGSADDDVDFVSKLIDQLADQYPLDTQRVYATGMSNGGFFTQRLACELNDRVAAFAPIASSLPAPLYASCKPGRPVSIMMINGSADEMVPWNGGSLAHSERMGGHGGEIISVPKTVEFWRNNAGCNNEQVSKLPDVDPRDGTRVKRTDYTACQPATASVVLISVEGGGHTWPGTATGRLLKRVVGETSRDINASQLIWEFFENHQL